MTGLPSIRTLPLTMRASAARPLLWVGRGIPPICGAASQLDDVGQRAADHQAGLVRVLLVFQDVVDPYLFPGECHAQRREVLPERNSTVPWIDRAIPGRRPLPAPPSRTCSAATPFGAMAPRRMACSGCFVAIA